MTLTLTGPVVTGSEPTSLPRTYQLALPHHRHHLVRTRPSLHRTLSDRNRLESFNDILKINFFIKFYKNQFQRR